MSASGDVILEGGTVGQVSGTGLNDISAGGGGGHLGPGRPVGINSASAGDDIVIRSEFITGVGNTSSEKISLVS